MLAALLLGGAAQAGAHTRTLACPPPQEGVVACPEVAAGTDYFIEARVRVRPGGAASGQLYLLGAYRDAGNWLGGGLSVTDGSPAVQAEIVRSEQGTRERLKQVKRNMPVEGRLLTVRFDISGHNLAIYLNGEKLSTATLPAPPAPGQIGLFSQGKQFEVLDVRTGEAGSTPGRLAPARAGHRLSAQAGDSPVTLAISHKGADGQPPAPLRVSSSDASVASVTLSQGAIVLTPHAPGSASITVTSEDVPPLETVIDATIAPAFKQPAATPARRNQQLRAVSPRHAGVQVDSLLRLKFERPPLPGAGSVRIYRSSDDALVEVIRSGEAIAAIGHAGQGQMRMVRHQPITVSGNTATIKPRGDSLAYGTAYYVVVEASAFPGATLGGAPFQGIGKAAGWTFRTRAAAPAGRRLTVDDDGPADFRTVQGAINHAMRHIARDAPVTIAIANGDYDETLFIRGKNRLTLRGQSRAGVVIRSGNNDGHNPGSGASQAADSPGVTGGRALLMVEEADLLTLEKLTLRNTTLRADAVTGQAETIYFNSEEGRLIARNASFFSEQDTIQVKGYAWFYRTLVAGNVDFIWGANRVALFEESEIRTVGDSAGREGGYVVQARTVSAADKGFVFLNSRLTSAPGPGPQARPVAPASAYLARSPGTAATWDNVSFIHCQMGPHIAPAGWAGKGVRRQPAANPAEPDADHGWREFGTTGLDGKALDLSGRTGGYQLSAEEAARRFGSRALIFSAFDGGKGWQPLP